MSNINSLSIIEGYDNALLRIKELEEDGIDYRKIRNETQRIIELYHPKRLKLEVSKIINETKSTKTIRFKSLTAYLPPFQAGQYINVFINIDGIKTSRPYAIASAPSEREYYEITVKRVRDGFVSDYLLDRLKKGDHLESTSASGNFYYNPLFHGSELVFLAGGSGVTPAMSMLREMAKKYTTYQFHLIYGSLVADDIIFKNELSTLESNNINITVTHVLSNHDSSYEGEKGFITAELIRRLTDINKTSMYYLCGPPIMYEFCLIELEKLGVPKTKIRCEVNGPPAEPEKQSKWPEDRDISGKVTVTVSDMGSFETDVKEPLLNALERHGYATQTACRSGECSLCRVKVISGQVYSAEESHTRKADNKFGFAHACVSYPIEDIEISLLD